MSISFDIDDLDDLEKMLKDLERGVSYDEIEFWTKRIKNDLKLKFPKKSHNIQIDVIKNDDDFQFQISIPSDVKDDVINTIQRYLADMPVITSAIFESLIDLIKKG